ncbi:Processing alpha glucosidase I [Puccinia graminis f. sp. tritici]|uniref:Mannosyl-oligosaccharide glucosidase n=1 Tax=Puccinia graminis f. sp. tritici TaxID=56615 RepID=A0A5B0RCK3_PUCGR|nr:Processing alpha glucosidase I [Puccinia graminis f. sp. tritici]KAA1123440.1 Processing alpha glucosidase I [Puccinia graminis f. sp. tritici]
MLLTIPAELGRLLIIPTLLLISTFSSSISSDSIIENSDPTFQALQQATNQSLLWGTYRPNLYFGLRPRQPHSLMTGMLWFGTQDFQSFARTRHSCEQSDELNGYGFDKHDGRNFASHYLKDQLNNVELRVQMLKVPGGQYGGSWALRINGKKLDEARDSKISLVNYFGLDGLGSFQIENEEDEEGIDGEVKISGSTTQLGDFTIRIKDSPTNKPAVAYRHTEDFGEKLSRTQYLGVQLPAGSIWKAKDSIVSAINEFVHPMIEKYTVQDMPDPCLVLTLPNEISYGSNLYALQRSYEAPFELDIYFDGDSAPRIDSAALSAGLMAASTAFDQQFKLTFPKIVSDYSAEEQAMAMEMVSSMIGGIGYFYGSSIVDRNFAHDYDDDGLLLTGNSEDDDGGNDRKRQPQLTEDRELFTATPSRSFFPRGFYWDEGFHLALIGAWDNDLSLEILQSWIKLIDRDGWVGREQILGEEARSKVPSEFQVQYSNHANPPTLTMAVTSYLKRLKRFQGADGFKDTLSDADLGLGSGQHIFKTTGQEGGRISDKLLEDVGLARSFLVSIYPKLKLHYEWFRETQVGQIREWGRESSSKTEGYRWRGRTAEHVLTSGIDDYPRGLPHVGELHLDLLCWVGFFTRTMKSIAEFIGENDDVLEYEKNYEAIVSNIDDLHWNEDKKMHCDVSVDANDESYFVCHKGYISIFPFLLGLVPHDSPKLKYILEDIRDPNGIWSDFGIRSLAKSDEFFGKNENYWRGPIWIPMNYMALNSLYTIYAKESGPYQTQAAELYEQLKTNVIKNVFKEWKRTGFTWEQYDPINGEGKRSKPFTGWTSLVAMIMAEEYDM